MLVPSAHVWVINWQYTPFPPGTQVADREYSTSQPGFHTRRVEGCRSAPGFWTSDFVMGDQMPAPNRRPVNGRTPSAGRRLTTRYKSCRLENTDRPFRVRLGAPPAHPIVVDPMLPCAQNKTATRETPQKTGLYLLGFPSRHADQTQQARAEQPDGCGDGDICRVHQEATVTAATRVHIRSDSVCCCG